MHGVELDSAQQHSVSRSVCWLHHAHCALCGWVVRENCCLGKLCGKIAAVTAFCMGLCITWLCLHRLTDVFLVLHSCTVSWLQRLPSLCHMHHVGLIVATRSAC